MTVPSLVEWHLDCLYVVATTIKAAKIFVHKYLFEHMISSLLDKNLGVECTDHTANACTDV